MSQTPRHINTDRSLSRPDQAARAPQAAPEQKQAARTALAQARSECRRAEAESRELRRKYPSVTQIQMIFQDPMASAATI